MIAAICSLCKHQLFIFLWQHSSCFQVMEWAGEGGTVCSSIPSSAQGGTVDAQLSHKPFIFYQCTWGRFPCSQSLSHRAGRSSCVPWGCDMGRMSQAKADLSSCFIFCLFSFSKGLLSKARLGWFLDFCSPSTRSCRKQGQVPVPCLPIKQKSVKFFVLYVGIDSRGLQLLYWQTESN